MDNSTLVNRVGNVTTYYLYLVMGKSISNKEWITYEYEPKTICNGKEIVVVRIDMSIK